ncbi:MAG: HAMP domain-containing sensor histidine kinase, partial [Fibrobacterota bacterium]
MSATGSFVLAVQAGLDYLHGLSQYANIETAGMLGMGIGYIVNRRGHFLSAAVIFLLSGHSVLFFFDDGFGRPASSWALHLLLIAAAFGLFDAKLKPWRWFWLAVSVLSVAVVNFTTIGPHWNTITAAGQEAFVGFSNLLVATLGIWLILHFMESRYLRELDKRDKLEQRLHASLAKEAKDSEAKSRLISHVSHEFRTPLNAISGFAQLMRTGNLSPSELSENMEAIHRSSDHLVHLVNDMLDMSRLEHGELKLAKIPFAPEEKIHDCTSLLQHLAKEKGIRLDEIMHGEIQS